MRLLLCVHSLNHTNTLLEKCDVTAGCSDSRVNGGRVHLRYPSLLHAIRGSLNRAWGKNEHPGSTPENRCRRVSGPLDFDAVPESDFQYVFLCFRLTPGLYQASFLLNRHIAPITHCQCPS